MLKSISFSALKLHKIQRLSASMLSLILLCAGTTCGAATNPAVSPTAEPAEQAIHQVLPLVDLPQTADGIEKVIKLEAEGEKYFQQNIIDKALTKWQDAYGLSMEMKYSEGEGRNLTNMCRVFLERGQFIKAKYMGENAVEVLANSSDKKALGRARMYLAQAYFGLDNSTWAGEQLDAALKLFTSGGSSQDAPEAASALHLAGGLLVRFGKMKEALQFYEQAATYYSQAGDFPRAVGDYTLVSGLMDAMGLFMAASEEAEKAVSIARSNPENKPLMVAALACKANAEYNLCEFANARRDYEQVLQLAQKLDFKSLDTKSRANIDIGYGFSLAATGDLEQSKSLLEHALPVLRSNGLISGQALSLNVLGNIEASEGDFAKAITHFNQALDLQGLVKPKDDKHHVLVLQNMAAAESRSGDNRQAKQHLDQALLIIKKTDDKVLEGRTLCSLAEVSLKLADVQQAEAYAQKAVALSERIMDDAALWRDYAIISKIQVAQGQLPEAKESLTSAMSHFRSPQAGVFATPDRLNFPSTREDFGEQLVSVVSKQGMAEQALLIAEQLKEESFSNEWHGWGSQVRPDDRDVYNDLVAQRAHLHAAESAVSPDKLIKDWQQWMVRFRTLVSQNRSLAKLIAPVPNTVADVMRAIQTRHATAVEYLVGHTSSVVFTLDPSGRISATVLPVGRKRLQSQVTAVLTPPAPDTPAEQVTIREKANLTQLFHELMPQAVRNFIPSSPDQMLVIIPDGVLFNLPFAALIDANGKYLVESHTLTMASSMGVLLDSPPRYSEDLSVVITSANAEQPGGDESNLIEHVLQPEMVTKLVGRDADIGNIQEQARGKAVVHFTTLMPLSGANPTRTVLPLRAGKDDANRRVTADRLFGLSLPSDLMVMSASSIPTKDIQGNAVQALSRGLSYAGVRNVMMSLWVEPSSTRTNELVEFYKSKQEGLNQAQSLRKAQLLALSHDPSPRAWAAFQLLGPGN